MTILKYLCIYLGKITSLHNDPTPLTGEDRSDIPADDEVEYAVYHQHDTGAPQAGVIPWSRVVPDVIPRGTHTLVLIAGQDQRSKTERRRSCEALYTKDSI